MSDSKPAFPFSTYEGPNVTEFGSTGMTLREYAAVAAMQGLLANAEHAEHVHDIHGMADLAVRNADALLSKLEERKP